MGAEEALMYLGGIGTWQLVNYFIISTLFALPSMWQLFAFVFEGFTFHDYHCRPAPGLTVDQSVPPSNKTLNGYSSCERYKYNSSYLPDQKVPCDTGYQVSPDYFAPETGTITMEFGLFCDKMYLVEVSQMLFTGGVVVGSWCFSPYADWFGRKKVFFLCQVVMCFFGIAMAFSTNFWSFCVFQFLTGAFTMGNDLAGFVLGNELFPAEMRAYMAPAMYLFVAVGMMSLVIFSYFLRHWRTLQLAVSLAPLLTMLYWWHCPESVRWLIANDRYDEAKNILDATAKTNGIAPVPMEVIKYEKVEVSAGEKHPTMSQYLKHRKTFVFFVAMCFLMISNNLLYFGLNLMAQTLPLDLYLAFFILAALEIPGTIAAILSMQALGRRIPLCFFNFFSAIFMALTTVFSALPAEQLGLNMDQQNILVVSFALTSKFGVAGAWSIELVYVQEIFPTNLRGLGVGLVGGAGYIGGILAPLGVMLARNLDLWVPTAIFASLTFIAGFVSLAVPETLGRPLPTTIDEILGWNLTLSKEDKEEYKKRKKELAEQRQRLRANQKSAEAHFNPAFQASYVDVSVPSTPTVPCVPSVPNYTPWDGGKDIHNGANAGPYDSSVNPTQL